MASEVLPVRKQVQRRTAMTAVRLLRYEQEESAHMLDCSQETVIDRGSGAHRESSGVSALVQMVAAALLLHRQLLFFLRTARTSSLKCCKSQLLRRSLECGEMCPKLLGISMFIQAMFNTP